MPTENEKLFGTPLPGRVSSALASSRRPTTRAPSASVWGIRMANSSPPIRNARSASRTVARREAAHLGQQLVAGGMAGGVVDQLEVVEVDQHERRAASM